MSSLRLQVLDRDTGWIAEVELASTTHELLDRQFELCLQEGSAEDFARWLAHALNHALPEEVGYELRPPSTAQINFATAIARALNIPLLPDVLRYRGSMHAFLDQHANTFRQRVE